MSARLLRSCILKLKRLNHWGEIMNRWLGYGVGSLISIVASFGPASADVIFTDSTFNLANYTATPTTPFSNNGTASLAVTQCPSCGVSGTGLQTVATFNS